MKFNLNSAFCALLALPLMFASCSKQGPEGPAGPAGPQGTAGSAGAAGAAGATGAQGTTGTANVIYSEWLDVTFQADTATNTANGKLDTLDYIAAIPAPQLVDSILNKGTIKVYLNLGGDSSGKQVVVTLPYSDPFLTGYVINAYFQNQLISLFANEDAGSFVDNGGNKRWQYRYVLIPGGTAAGRNPKGAIDWNNYAEVKKYLGLKD